jgi:apolipoprotein N-acyltransferase
VLSHFFFASILGIASFLSIIEWLPAWFSLLALLGTFELARRQTVWLMRGFIFAAYLFSVNLLVANGFFGLYSIQTEGISGLYGLVIVYVLVICLIMTVTFSPKLSISSIVLFSSALTLAERFVSEPSIFQNWAVPMLHSYYLFTPELFGLYAQFGMYGAVFVICSFLLLGVRVLNNLQVKEIMVFVVGLLFVVLVSNLISFQTPSEYLEVNVIQPGIIGEGERLSSLTHNFINQNLARNLKPNVLNILPENSVSNYDFKNDVFKLLRYDNLLMGGLIRNQYLVYNSIVLLQEGKIQDTYNKTFLVPIEEEQWLQPGSPEQTNTILYQNKILGVGICYEGAFHQIGTNGVRNGAQLFIIVSNTQTQTATALQLRGIKVRAAETGRAFIFAAMAGHSSLINFQGQVEQKMMWAKPESMVTKTPLYSARSSLFIQSQWIDILILALFCFSGLWCLGAYLRLSISGTKLYWTHLITNCTFPIPRISRTQKKSR